MSNTFFEKGLSFSKRAVQLVSENKYEMHQLSNFAGMKDYDGKVLEAYTLYVLAIESFLLGMKCKLLRSHNFNLSLTLN